MGNESSFPVTGGLGNNHTPLPNDAFPYTGPQLEYKVLIVRSKVKTSFGGHMHSDINDYMATLQQQYGEYFKLNTFFRVPYASEASGFTSELSTFQAIHSRPSIYVPSPEHWQLHIEQTTLGLSPNLSGNLFSRREMNSDLSDLYNRLTARANAGGRLICLECTGNKQRAGWGSVNFGVNMFFNVPTHPNPVIYTNLAYSVPMQINRSFGGDVDVQIDILGTLAMHLDQGWKLTDIIIPQHEAGMTKQDGRDTNAHGGHRGTSITVGGHHGTSITVGGHHGTSITVGRHHGISAHGGGHHGVSAQVGHNVLPSSLTTIWFFEKEAIRFNANDMSPQYQVTMVDISVPVSVGFGKTYAQCDLAPILTQMGQRGWSLVCLLDTPKVHRSGMTGAVGYLKAFFQRPIVQNIAPPVAGAPYLPQYSAAPPAFRPPLGFK